MQVHNEAERQPLFILSASWDKAEMLTSIITAVKSVSGLLPCMYSISRSANASEVNYPEPDSPLIGLKTKKIMCCITISDLIITTV